MKRFFAPLLFCFLTFTAIAQTQFWGMTYNGGQCDQGMIFRTDGSGNNPVVASSFIQNNGSIPLYGKLLEASDGKMYGFCSAKGLHDIGVLFQYDPITNITTDKIYFDSVPSGAKPCGSLIQASDGKLYGMTSQGGVNNIGVIFRYDPVTGAFTKLVDFARTLLSPPPMH